MIVFLNTNENKGSFVSASLSYKAQFKLRAQLRATKVLAGEQILFFTLRQAFEDFIVEITESLLKLWKTCGSAYVVLSEFIKFC